MSVIKYKEPNTKIWKDLFKDSNIEVFLQNTTYNHVDEVVDASGYIDISSITDFGHGCFIYLIDTDSDYYIDKSFFFIWIGNLIVYNRYDSSNGFDLEINTVDSSPDFWLFDATMGKSGKTYTLNYYKW